MDHGVDTGVIAVFAGCVVLWGVVSSRLERISITAPIAFVVLGLVVANEPLALIDVPLRSDTLRSIAELTLALVLFTDASRVHVKELKVDAGLACRLLLIGLPLAIAAGTALALVLFGGIDVWVAAIIGAAVAPTDAALGAPIFGDPRVPVRLRRLLNVESGLNDGIATPFVNVFVAGAIADLASGPSVDEAVIELAIGIGAGIVIGIVGGLALETARRCNWTSPGARGIAVLALALFAYSATIQLDGNGFVGAFVGGIAFGSVSAPDRDSVGFAEGLGQLLSIMVWFFFGAAMIVPAFENFEWTDAVFAVGALTVARMVPVAIALIGARLSPPTVVLVGWLGPRGLASVVFALLAYDMLPTTDGNRVLAAVTATVLMSVVLHGVTASPLAARYARIAARLPRDAEELVGTPELATRAHAGTKADA